MASVGAVSPPEVILCCSRAGRQSFEIDTVEQQNFHVREAYSFLFFISISFQKLLIRKNRPQPRIFRCGAVLCL